MYDFKYKSGTPSFRKYSLADLTALFESYKIDGYSLKANTTQEKDLGGLPIIKPGGRNKIEKSDKIK